MVVTLDYLARSRGLDAQMRGRRRAPVVIKRDTSSKYILRSVCFFGDVMIQQVRNNFRYLPEFQH